MQLGNFIDVFLARHHGTIRTVHTTYAAALQKLGEENHMLQFNI